MSPARIAYRVSSSRSFRPSFCSRLARCRSTVLTLITSRSAISLEELPSATSLRISSSRSVMALAGMPSPSGAVEVVADQRVHRAGVEERLAAHRRTAGLDQVAVGDGLEHVPGRARLERLEEVLLVVVHREDQDPQVRQQSGQFACGLQPGQPRHGDVEDREVRPFLAGHGDRLGAVARLGRPRSGPVRCPGSAGRRGARARGRRRAGCARSFASPPADDKAYLGAALACRIRR